jgi:hypothetical protein
VDRPSKANLCKNPLAVSFASMLFMYRGVILRRLAKNSLLAKQGFSLSHKLSISATRNFSA